MATLKQYEKRRELAQQRLMDAIEADRRTIEAIAGKRTKDVEDAEFERRTHWGTPAIQGAGQGAAVGGAFGGPVGAAWGALGGATMGTIAGTADAYNARRERGDSRLKSIWDTWLNPKSITLEPFRGVADAATTSSGTAAGQAIAKAMGSKEAEKKRLAAMATDKDINNLRLTGAGELGDTPSTNRLDGSRDLSIDNSLGDSSSPPPMATGAKRFDLESTYGADDFGEGYSNNNFRLNPSEKFRTGEGLSQEEIDAVIEEMRRSKGRV